jgi:threonine dehydrogenase-like Zn-dependent dehydrogenase
MQRGDIMGHEFMDEVIETGPDVDPAKLRPGDRKVVLKPWPQGGIRRLQEECGIRWRAGISS